MVVRLDRPGLLRELRGREVRGAPPAALRGQIDAAVRTLLDHGLVRVERARAVRAGEARELRDREIVAQLLEARREAEVELRLLIARVATLGEDLNDAIRRLGPVQRRGGRALQHFDPLDVVRVQVTETVGRRATAERAAGAVLEPLRGALVDANAIDVDRGPLRERERRRAADADVLSRTDASAHGRGAKPGDFGGQHATHIGNRHLFRQLRGVDLTDRRADLALLDGATRTGDDDLL